MTTFNVTIDDEELVTRFRLKVTREYSRYRGNVGKAFTEAMRDWVNKVA